MSKEKTRLYIVDTLVTFRNRYVIEAKSLEHAYDEVTMVESGADNDFFEPVSQLYMGEHIIDGRKISYDKFDKLINKLKREDNPRETSSYWMGDQLIRVIDYGNDITKNQSIEYDDE